MSDYPTIETAPYTWHPIISLATLLKDMQADASAAAEAERNYVGRGANIKKFNERFAAAKPVIIKMKAQGKSHREIGEALDIPLGTITDYSQRIQKERGLWTM